MKIELRRYGEILVSRPGGREALAAMLAYLPVPAEGETIDLDFEGVLVMAPSWLDDVLAGLRARFGDRVRCLPSENASVRATLHTLGEPVPAQRPQ